MLQKALLKMMILSNLFMTMEMESLKNEMPSIQGIDMVHLEITQ